MAETKTKKGPRIANFRPHFTCKREFKRKGNPAPSVCNGALAPQGTGFEATANGTCPNCGTTYTITVS